LNPKRQVRRIGRAGWAGLTAALRAVLRDSIEAGGTTLRDFHNADGKSGCYAVELRVYDREGDPCERCGSTIRKIVQGGRSTFYCPRCQR
jgi:formamidopyrimidine-DNA glycosylase